MEKEQAKNLIQQTFNSKFNKAQFTKFAMNLLDELNIEKWFEYQNAYVKESFRKYIDSYGRIGKYIDEQGNDIEVLWVNLKKETALDRARTMQRNFIAWYLNGGRGGEIRHNALVAFYNEELQDWRFSFVKLDSDLVENEKGEQRVKNNFTAAKRFSFLVGENEPNHTAQTRLVDVLAKNNPVLEDIEEAFNIEKVSNEFFATYKELFLQLVDNLKEVIEKDPNQRIKCDFVLKQITEANFCKKLLGQLVFLYFIQKKGWLGVHRHDNWGQGDKKFLRTAFEKAVTEGKNFFNDYLEPLFYEALAKERDGDYFSLLDCKIPFLNGGLFEAIGDYDWVSTDIIFDNSIFSNTNKTKNDDIGDGILDIFDRYNFTVKEDEPLEKEVAIDPEMLGKVFEELLPVQDRKSKGAFYTPREIVHYMCQESLINYLCMELKAADKPFIATDVKQSRLIQSNTKQLDFENHITKQAISDFVYHADKIAQNEAVAKIKAKEGLKSTRYDFQLDQSIRENAKMIDEALENIKICDPAIGSGAFPVGMMNEIIRVRMALVESGYLNQTKKRTSYDYKRQAIQNSIYGVDIDSGAIEIAKLRLWLSLVVDEDDINTIKPLPNLDYKIVCGNSLLSLHGAIIQESLRQRFTELAALNFDETRKTVKKAYKKEIDEILSNIFRTAKSFNNNANFDFRFYFHEVFQGKGGFDIVIGNPPYIKEYTDKSAFDGLRNSPYYQGKMDLWYFFGCVGLDILKPKGVQTYIAPNNWMTNAGASIFRNKILDEAKILNFIDFGNYKVFETASIQTMVYLLLKTSSNTDYKLNYSKLLKDDINKTELDNFLSEQISSDYYIKSELAFNNDNYKNQYVTFLDPKTERLVTKIKSGNKKYLRENEVAQGIVTPQDFLNKKNQKVLQGDCKVGEGIFILTNNEKENKKFSDVELNDLIRPLYTSDEISRYYAQKCNKNWIIYTSSRFNRPSEILPYSNVKVHLDRFSPVITSDNKPYGLHRSRDEKFFKGEKIISLRKCGLPTFSYVDFDCYVLQTFFVLKTQRINLKYLTAILNSKLIAFWLKHKGKLQGNNYQVDKEPLLGIPIHNPNKAEEDVLVSLVNKILDLTKSEDYLQNEQKQQAVKEYEKQIDDVVYQLYELTDEEILSIDPNRLTGFKFSSKPSVKEIVGKIAQSKPSLLDSDREFCCMFDKIALNNGFNNEEMPSYWTIGRAIYAYKQENNIAANENAPTTSILAKDVDLNNPLLKQFSFDIKKPSIKSIIEKIATYDSSILENDRKLTELFDSIALTNGYDKENLPKYWTIIRTSFDYKKELTGA